MFRRLPLRSGNWPPRFSTLRSTQSWAGDANCVAGHRLHGRLVLDPTGLMSVAGHGGFPGSNPTRRRGACPRVRKAAVPTDMSNMAGAAID